MKTEILPFRQEMISDAAALLAACHQRDRQALPFLPPRFEELTEAETAVQCVLDKALSGGYAAVRGGKMVAYLIGNWTVEPWGRCGWIWQPGSALSAGEPTAILQDLYVRLGDDWVSSGVFYHSTYQCIADRNVIGAWFDLGFGKERIDAVSDFREYDIPEIQIPGGVEIRRAGRATSGTA